MSGFPVGIFASISIAATARAEREASSCNLFICALRSFSAWMASSCPPRGAP
jgi:hypothetical protein